MREHVENEDKLPILIFPEGKINLYFSRILGWFILNQTNIGTVSTHSR